MSRLATKGEQLDEIDRWSLLVMRMRQARMPLWAMEELVRAFEHGVRKHGAGDYLEAYASNPLEPFVKATRHMGQMYASDHYPQELAVDEESGVLHVAKTAANLLIGIEVAHVA